MSAGEIILLVLSAFTFFQWFVVVYEGWRFEKQTKEFDRIANEPLDATPVVTVIVPARNEEAGIRACLLSLLEQDYEALEIIAIDDRSTDATGAIMDDVGSRDSRVKVLHVNELPSGWLGKNHANWLGTRAASMDTQFFVFTDGDVQFQRRAISSAMKFSIRCELDQLVLSPFLKSSGSWLAAVQVFFGIAFLSITRPSRLGKSKDAYVGIGAFNMVRRKVYALAGGHERMKLEIIDDGMLGKIMVEAGARTGIINGRKLLSLAWYHSLGGFVAGLEKNGFAALRYSLPRLAVFVVLNLWLYIVPYFIIAFSDGPVRIAYLGNILLIHLGFAFASRLMNEPMRLTFLVPFSSLIIIYTFVRSAVLTRLRDGVSWRETHYSLAELKRHMV